MKKIPISIICGIIAIIVTFLLYFVIIDDIFSELICLITLGGVIFAETVLTLLIYFAKADPRKLMVALVSAIMIPVAVILSWVYILNFPEGYVSYLIWYACIFAILVMFISTVWRFANNAEDKNADLQSAKSNILEMRNLVKCISLEHGAADYKNELDKIEEKLHFSNDAIIVENDKVIRDLLVILQSRINDDNFDVVAQLETINRAIDRRNIMAK